MQVKNWLLVILFLVVFKESQGQILKNGSLEGPNGVTTTPDDWYSCKSTSTVDVQPGLWGVDRAPQHGTAYIDMVCRGNFNTNMNTCEELGQTLNQTLEAGKCYRLDLYLSYFSNFAIPNFRNSIDLRISAGVNDCNRDFEIAYHSAIDHDDWRKYTTYFSPDADLNSFWLEAEYSQLPTYFGHVLIDNLSIEEVTDPPAHELILCEDQRITLAAFETENATAYSWSNGSNDAQISIGQAGTYTVDITLGNCVITETFEVTLQEAPALELTSDTNICLGEEVLLNASTAGATYLWHDGSENATFSATAPGNYSVLVTVGDCTSSFSITLEEDVCTPLLEMPNAFTPNQDGKNDLFTPITSRNISTLQTVIYSRWGDRVFESNSLMILWDGSLPNGEDAPPSTYYWRIQYTDIVGNSRSVKGTVTLIR